MQQNEQHQGMTAFRRRGALQVVVVLALLCTANGAGNFAAAGSRKAASLQRTMQARIRRAVSPRGSLEPAREQTKVLSPSSKTPSNVARDGSLPNPIPSRWPSYDQLDKQLIAIAIPTILNFAISPIVGAIDLFFINRMGEPLAVAGQAASNQVFGSAFWLGSFLPSITAILVSREHASGNKEGVQDAVCEALFVAIIFACFGSVLLLLFPDKALSSVLKQGAPALKYAKPYLMIRSLSFLPGIISLVGFSAFRGVLDSATPVRISAFANVFHAVLCPIAIFALGMGVSGAAFATLVAEVIAAFSYLFLMNRRNLIRLKKLLKLPEWAKLRSLLQGGLALQLRNVAFNITFIAVTRVTQSIDDTGVGAAAHAMAIQTFQLGGIVLLAMSVVAQTVVPHALIPKYNDEKRQTVGGISYARATVSRLMSWGLILGTVLGGLQILLLPLIMKSTPLQEVRDAARAPAYLASVLQVINGLIFIGEGVMTGCGDFMQLSISTALASAGCLWALKTLPPVYGLTGIWFSFAVFNAVRLVCVFIHQYYTSPLANKKLSITT